MTDVISNQNPTDDAEGLKPWWQSRGVVGSLVTVAASLAGLIGWSIDVQQTTELLMLAITLAGGVASWWGRVKAERPISRTQVAPGVTLRGQP